MPAVDNDLYSEWSSGVSLANTSGFFEEIPTELEHPANFEVTPEQLPGNPLEPNIPQIDQQNPPSVSVTQEDEPEAIELEGGGSILIEKTGKGWKATLDSGEQNIPAENFYGDNKTKLIANLAKGKLQASKLILKLKRDKMLGGDEPQAVSAPVAPRNVARANVLTADEVYEIKNKVAENPAEALDIWVEKRFGLSAEEFAEALKSAPEAKRIVEAQRVKSEVEAVNTEFVDQNPDYLEYVSSEDDVINKNNIRVLVGRMAKAYLNKKITKNTAQATVDDTIFELYNKGAWTADNLEKAKDELVENGLFERPAPPRQSTPQPQPVVAPSDPSVPAAPRIAATTGQPVGLVGLPARSSTPTVIPEEKSLSGVDLQKMPLEQLRLIAQAQLRAMQNQ